MQSFLGISNAYSQTSLCMCMRMGPRANLSLFCYLSSSPLLFLLLLLYLGVGVSECCVKVQQEKLHKSHVPKFGNWDGDNVPYTAYFENARKEKTSGTKINPNDPEQNPEAFGISLDNQTAPQKYTHKTNNVYSQQRSSTTANSSHKTLEYSSSDQSPSINSVAPIIKPSHHRKKSDRSKFTSSNSTSPADDYSYRSVSVPKFGEWDEKDPRSAEGFTVIFNKVKEEKQIATAKLPPVPLQTVNNYEASQKKETRKRCCCLF